jgi:membrane protease YdiL (CAAX protease family)
MLKLHRGLDGSFALAIVILIVSTEYFFRHYFLFWLPVLGTMRVNDMISLLFAYSLLVGALGFIAAVEWSKEWHAVGRAVYDCVTSWSYTPWIIALALNIGIVSMLDRLLFSNIMLPVFESAHHDSTVWLLGLAPTMKGISLLFVNGLCIPVAEEFLWRGLVQPRLVRILSLPLGIGTTAILFSLKHVIVDGNFGRFLMVCGFGVICGIFAHRKGWSASAALHALINTTSSILALALGAV